MPGLQPTKKNPLRRKLAKFASRKQAFARSAEIVIKPSRDSFLGKQGEEFVVEYRINNKIVLRRVMLKGDLRFVRQGSPLGFPPNPKIIRKR